MEIEPISPGERALRNLLYSVMSGMLGDKTNIVIACISAFVADETIPPETLVEQINKFGVWQPSDQLFIHAALLLYRKTGEILPERWIVY